MGEIYENQNLFLGIEPDLIENKKGNLEYKEEVVWMHNGKYSEYDVLGVVLKERKVDIPLLVEHFIEKYSNQNNKNIKKIDASALNKLMKQQCHRFGY